MPADHPPAAVADLDKLISRLTESITASIREASPPPLLLDAEAAWTFVGLSKSAFYRLVGTSEFPRAVEVSGCGPRWRRADLERWAGKLKPRRRRPSEVTA